MKITFLLPTCEPESMFKFLLPTIHLLKPIKHLIEFNICFQPPYTKAEIHKVLAEFKRNYIKVNHMFKNYRVVKPYTPLIRMRNDCALMSPNSDIYGLLDDDMSFEFSDIVECIKSMINQFKTETKLSVVSFYNQPVINHKENFYSTNAGLFYRGGKFFGFKGLIPKSLNDFNTKVYTKIPYENENLIELFGGHQDKFCAMIRLATGTYGRCMINVPVNHLENRLTRGDQQHGWKNAEVLDGSITSFILKYFNKNFIDTHALTLFDTETNKLIYPYKYRDGKLKEQYDLYDERGIIKDWFSNINERYGYGNPYVVKYKQATYWSKWNNKKIRDKYNYLKSINILEHLPPDIVDEINSMVDVSKTRTKVITVFSIDYFGKNKFKNETAKDCYWSWNRSLSLPIRRQHYDFQLKIFDPRWENKDLIIFKNRYRNELQFFSDDEKEKLFILYILSKYPNHLYLNYDVFTTDNTNFVNEPIFDVDWKCIYNVDNINFFKNLFTKYKNKSISNLQLKNKIKKFTNKLNFEIKK